MVDEKFDQKARGRQYLICTVIRYSACMNKRIYSNMASDAIRLNPMQMNISCRDQVLSSCAGFLVVVDSI